jgi:hypothetical protein
VRTVLGEQHQPRFAGLSPEGAALVLSRLVDCGALRRTTPRVESGLELFEVCRLAGLDHAGVVLTLAAETNMVGLRALEQLVGRPISPWAESVEAARAQVEKPPVRGVAAAAAAPRPGDGQWVVAVRPNPKKPGSDTHARYAHWVVGRTVRECLAAGLTRADLAWDVTRGFVTLSDTPPEAS